MTDSTSVVRSTILRQVLRDHGFTLRKSLGQNFLIDEHVLSRIVEAGSIASEDGVFEIGPGAGVLTQRAAKMAKRVVAVEKDARLEQILEQTLQDCDNVEVLYADVLDLDLTEVWQAFSDCRRVIVIANLPYYVTTPILFQLLESDLAVTDIIVMVQSEVARRLTAAPATKDYGALTVSVSFRAEVTTVVQVHKGAFLPPPRVDSTVVRLHCYEEPPVTVTDTLLFKKVVRAAFATRRKTLQNALGHGLSLTKPLIRKALETSGISPERRGETLSLAEFAELTTAIQEAAPTTE